MSPNIRRPEPQARRLLTVALAVALLGVAGVALSARAATPAQGSPRIVVVAFPDLAGDGPSAPTCLGCDGQFGTGDQLLAGTDPLPALEVVVRDPSGTELDRATTSPPQPANGRQAAAIDVASVGDYEVELVLAPGWSVCPTLSLTRTVSAADFDPTTNAARVQYGLWHGCASAPPTATADLPTAEPTGTAGATSAAPTQTVTATATVTATPATPAGSGAGTRKTLPSTSLGRILGLVFVDANLDGKLGPDEPGVSGVAVRLEGEGVTRSGETAGAGTFEFADLAAGAYDVAIAPPEGMRVTTTDRYLAVRVSGDDVAGIDFGLATSAAPSSAQPDAGPASPRAGADDQPIGQLLLVLAALAGGLGLCGLALETGLARRS